MRISAESSDETLMTMLQQKELAALEALYDRHHRLVLALAHRVLGDRETAEDIVQETFLTAWRQAAVYSQERGRVRGWLLSIARNRAIDRLRRTRNVRQIDEVSDSLVDQRSANLEEAIDEKARRERLRQALAVLSADQREAVELAYYGGLTHQEISQRTGAPLGTVKGRMRLAMEKLRLALADLAPEVAGE